MCMMSVALLLCAAFGPKDSGTPDCPRVIEGRVFSAAVELTGWTDDGNGVWSCPAVGYEKGQEPVNMSE